MEIYNVEVATINYIIKKNGNYILYIDNKYILKCIKIDNSMVDLKNERYYEIINTDFTYVIDESYIKYLKENTFYALRYEKTDLIHEPYAFYYKEKAKIYEKKAKNNKDIKKPKQKNNVLIFNNYKKK